MMSVTEVVAGWARDQAAPWGTRRLDRAAAERACDALNARWDHYFLFRFEAGGARLLETPHFSAAEIAQAPGGHAWRARAYLGFFDLVARTCGIPLDGVIAMSMDDIVHEQPDCGVFGFQKRRGSTALLVPDIDAVRLGFHAEGSDRAAFIDKLDRAIFVGSTTGMYHSYDSVLDRASPRLRSAERFTGVAEVDFRLPNIVQCLSEEAAAAIRELGFGVGATSWEEQLACKFLISMDGNGATCSRVALALKSNSVLLKYDSDYELYYFAGLQPQRHYIAIARDADVVGVVRAEKASPGRFAPVAEHGRRFFEAYLKLGPSISYTAQVLARYFASLGDMAEGVPAAVNLVAVVHIATRGDVASDAARGAGVAGSGLALEGFSLEVLGELRATLSYRAIGDGWEGEWMQAGSFAGSRGASRPLRGFAVRLSGEAAGLRCCYAGWFVGHGQARRMEDGAACLSPDGAALESMTVSIQAAPQPGSGLADQ